MRFTSRCYTLSPYALIIASLTLAPSIAQALDTNYQSASGMTRVLLENTNGDSKWFMDYQTPVNGETWSGRGTFERVLGHDGNRTLYGTFQDYPGPSFPGTDKRSCTGDVTAIQTFQNDRYQLKVNWTVTGGKNCPAIGKTYNLDLSEAIPIADAKGNFQFKNTATWVGLGPNQSDVKTWDRWQVVDESLNCRVRPNGSIVRTYRRGDRLASRYEGRGGNPTAFMGSENTEATPDKVRQFKGEPWMLTGDKCYVRSNRQYIQPLSFSQPFKPALEQ